MCQITLSNLKSPHLFMIEWQLINKIANVHIIEGRECKFSLIVHYRKINNLDLMEIIEIIETAAIWIYYTITNKIGITADSVNFLMMKICFDTLIKIEIHQNLVGMEFFQKPTQKIKGFNSF